MPDPSLKILINISAETRAGLQGLAKDFREITSAVKGIDFSSLNNASQSVNNLVQANKDLKDSVDKHVSATKEQINVVENLQRSMEGALGAVKFLAGGFLALEGIRFFKEIADNAARAQVLGTVLQAVGKNAGYTSSELDNTDRAVQRMGITAQSSRQSLATLITANIDLSKATALARASQDLAVISGENSSQTFQRLIHAIEVRSTMDLRFLGINVRLEEAEAKYAATLGKTASQLNQRQQSEAVLSAVLENAQKRAGTYVEAMGDVGKQLTSLERLETNLSTSMGKQLLPAYLAVVQELSLFLEQLTATSDAANAASDGGQRLGEIVQSIASTVREGALVLAGYWKEILGGIAAITALTTVSAISAIGQTAFGVAMKENIVVIGDLVGALVTASTTMLAYGADLVAIASEEGIVTAALSLVALGFGGVTGAVDALTAALAANPLTLPLVAIAALITACAALIIHFHDLSKGATWGETLRGSINFVLQPIQRLIELMEEFGTAAAQAFSDSFGGFQTLKELISEVSGPLGTLDKFVSKVFNGLGDRVTYANNRLKELTKGLLEAVGFSKSLSQEIDEAKARDEANTSNDPVARYMQSLQNRLDAQRTYLAAKRALERGAATQEQVDAAKDAAVRASLATEAAQKAFDNDKAATPAQIAAANAQKQRVKDAEDANNALVSEQQLLKNGQVDPTTGRFMSKEEAQSLTDFTNILGEFNKTSQPTVQQTGILRQGFKALAETVSDPQALAGLRQQYEALEKTGNAAAIAGARTQLALAQQRVANKLRTETAPIDAAPTKNRETAAKAITDQAELELSLLKTRNADMETVAKEGYEKGTVSLQDYYDIRRQVIVENYNKEIEVQRDKILQLEASLRNPQLKPEDRKAIQENIDSSYLKLNDTTGKENSEKDALSTQEARDRYTIMQKIMGIQAQTLKDTGAYVGTLAEIDKKYADLEVSTHAFGDANTQAILAASKAAEVLKANLTEIDRQQQANEASSNALIEAQRERVTGLSNNGRLSEQEQMLANNDLIRQQQDVVASQLAANQEKAALINKAMQDAIAANPNLLTQNPGALNGYIEQTDELGTKAQELKTQYEALGDSIETYGQKIRDSFEGSIADALTNLVTNFRQAQNTLVGLGKSLEKTLFDGFDKNISKKLFNSITDATSKDVLGPDGKPVIDPTTGKNQKEQGTSIFDSLGKAFGLGDKDPLGSSASKPQYVSVVNLPDSKSTAKPLGVGGTTSYTSDSRADGLSGDFGIGGTTTLPSEAINATTGLQSSGNGTLQNTITAGMSSYKSAAGGNIGAALSSGFKVGSDLLGGKGGSDTRNGVQQMSSMDQLSLKLARLMGFKPVGTQANLNSIIAKSRGAGSGINASEAKSSDDKQLLLPNVDGTTTAGGASGNPNVMGLDPYGNPTGSNVAGILNKAGGDITSLVNSMGGSSSGNTTTNDPDSNVDAPDYGSDDAPMDYGADGFAHGGVIGGYSSHDRADNILAKVTAGEHITNVKSTRKWLPLLEMINKDTLPVQSIALPTGLRIPKFASGGLVGGGVTNPAHGTAPASGPQFLIHPDMATKTLGDWWNDMMATAYAGR